ncbi:hypothetical protein PsYK624_081730 [Phanerochaete sordida]|uniref:Fungal-type protein kinase domain-containing protein n=1 Tax=Phanerochaete sordida TaxID=48140 RepID=A0A9P3LE89_9APHY|nr:hypothetical protein PsYK624_081730 [Phanerochaete sordida]
MSLSDERFVGAIPPELFLDRFMKPFGDCASPPAVDFSKLGSAHTVQDISEALIRASEKHKICPALRLFITKVKKRNLEVQSFSVDGRRKDHENGAKPNLSGDKVELCPPVAGRRQLRPRRAAKTRRNFMEYHDFATADLGFVILCSLDEDPFCDPKTTPESDNGPPSCATHAPAGAGVPVPCHAPCELSNSASEERCAFERDTPEAAATRLRLEAYAGASFARQHRRFLFQVVIIGDQARFLRWDRSGCIVSSRFSVVHTPHLADFLWRFNHMDSQQRGWDLTATLATRPEAKLFEDAVRSFLGPAKAPMGPSQTGREIPNAEETLDSTNTYPTWKIRVTHEETRESTDLIVRRPFAGHRTMFGRATRAYLALDLISSRLVFLKDTWRVNDTRIRPEFRTYQDLRSRDVPFIPYPMYGGDVQHPDGSVQETVGPSLAAEGSAWFRSAATLQHHVHHRLVQDIAYRLDSVRDERELMQAIHDALIALDRAYSELGLIHRDISALNIMLTSDGKCMLSDWDHAGTLDQRARGVGTFQFMSARLLISDSVEINEHVDDLESLFWVLFYIALIRFATPWDDMPLDVFHGSSAGGVAAGKNKRMHLYCAGTYKFRSRFQSEAFGMLIADLSSAWADYQITIDPYVLDADDPLTPEHLRKGELAKEPSFWIEKIPSALRQYDAEKADAAARPPRYPPNFDPYALLAQARLRSQEGIPAPDTAEARTGAKRKASATDRDGDVLVAPHPQPAAADPPRRSKRLKILNGLS